MDGERHARAERDAAQSELARLREALARLGQRVAEQQQVETAYAMEEASEDEMFSATAATYAAANRAARALSTEGGEG